MEYSGTPNTVSHLDDVGQAASLVPFVLGAKVCTCNPSTWVTGVHGHPWLHRESEASLGCMKPQVKTAKQQASKQTNKPVS